MKGFLRSLVRYLSALGLVLWSFTIGFLVSNRARGLIWKIRTHFGLRTTDAIVPEVSAAEALGGGPGVGRDGAPGSARGAAPGLPSVGAEPMLIAEPFPRDGNVTLIELAIIVGLVRAYEPRALFEIGTFDGRTTLNLALNSAPEARVYTLDLPSQTIGATGLHITTSDRHFVDKPASGECFRARSEAGKITQLYGDSATFDFGPYLNRMDFVFLDGSHAYEYVVNDTRVGLKLLRGGHGVVLWHDYAALPGVTNALNMMYATQPELRGTRHVEGTSLTYVVL